MEPEPIATIIGQLGVIAFVVAKVVERIRVRFPRVDGDLVTLVATVAGSGVAWWYDLDASMQLAGVAMPEPINYLVSGLFIATGAGVVADITHRSGNPGDATVPVDADVTIEPTAGPDGLPADPTA